MNPLEKAARRNPYWIFLYDWDLISVMPKASAPQRRMGFDKIVMLLAQSQFPPIGKN